MLRMTIRKWTAMKGPKTVIVPGNRYVTHSYVIIFAEPYIIIKRL